LHTPTIILGSCSWLVQGRMNETLDFLSFKNPWSFNKGKHPNLWRLPKLIRILHRYSRNKEM
jgi:hypothetical protein